MGRHRSTYAVSNIKSGYFESTDFHADAFISAAGITDATQKLAIRYLVSALKRSGVWYKCYAIYPLVGGVADSHKYNLKDVTLYNLTYNGTITHSSNGIDFAGATTSYASTGLVPYDVMIPGDSHFSVYTNESSTGGTLIGCFTAFEGGGSVIFRITPRRNTTFDTVYTSEADPGISFPANSDSKGYYIVNRVASSRLAYKGYKDGVNNYSASGASTSSTELPSTAFALGGLVPAINVANYSNLRAAFATIGSGLTDKEVSDLNAINTAYQKILNRYL